MYSSIQISKINDFVFCPYSIYYHSIYENFSSDTYHEYYQKRGSIKHKIIDKNEFSSRKKYLQALPIYCSKYDLVGKIDIFDLETKTLIERKYKVSRVYDGLRYQLYAQLFGLEEVGFVVNKLVIYSLSDNKKYNIPLPDLFDKKMFGNLIRQIKKFNPAKDIIKTPKKKCCKCIYSKLCTKSNVDVT